MNRASRPRLLPLAGLGEEGGSEQGSVGRAGVAPHTCPDIAAAEWPTLMMMTMANGIAAAPARTRPTHADGHRPVFEGRKGPHEQCDRDEKSSISKVALRIGDGTWKESRRERGRSPSPPLITRHPFRLQNRGFCRWVVSEAEKMRPKENSTTATAAGRRAALCK